MNCIYVLSACTVRLRPRSARGSSCTCYGSRHQTSSQAGEGSKFILECGQFLISFSIWGPFLFPSDVSVGLDFTQPPTALPHWLSWESDFKVDIFFRGVIKEWNQGVDHLLSPKKWNGFYVFLYETLNMKQFEILFFLQKKYSIYEVKKKNIIISDHFSIPDL